MSHGIGCREELVVPRDGCRTRWLSHAMVVASDACRKELVVARNWWSQGIGGRKEGIGGRKEGIGGRKEQNWWSQGIGSRKELVLARNW